MVGSDETAPPGPRMLLATSSEAQIENWLGGQHALPPWDWSGSREYAADADAERRSAGILERRVAGLAMGMRASASRWVANVPLHGG